MINWDEVLERLTIDQQSNTPEALTLKDVLYRLYVDQRLSRSNIAALTKGLCSSTTMGVKIKQLGIKLRGPGGPNNLKHNVPIAFEDYQIMSYVELGKKYKVSRATVHRLVRVYISQGGKKRGRRRGCSLSIGL